MMRKSFSSFVVLSCALAFVAVLLGGCDDMSASSALPIIMSSSYPQLSPIEPPSPRYEEIPVIETPETSIWKEGYWNYNGSSFDWVPGEVIARPAPTAIWVSSYWIQHTYGWALVPGYWQ